MLMRARTTFIVMLGAVLCGTRILAGAQTPAPGPAMPFEDAGACPFECCAYREWIARERVAVRSARRAGAPAVFTINKGDRVQAITGIVVTTRAGRVQFRRPENLSTNLGPLQVQPGETLYLLTNRGEGETAAWFKGQFYNAIEGSAFFYSDCADRPGTCNGTILEWPQFVWWARVRNSKGVEGWTREPDKFDNKDACGC